MLRVLIADDEPNVCSLIYKLINWKQLDLTCIGMVQNGEDAYELAKSEHPDIIITDISMPVIDGLELIGKLQQDNITAKIIIISGYHLFEYAHQAIKYGVSDFLTKPINSDELFNALYRICDDILTSRKDTESIEKLNSTFYSLSANVRKQFLYLIKNPTNEKILSIAKANKQYFYKFQEGIFLVGYLHIDNNETSELHQRAKPSYLHAVFEQNFHQYCYDMEFVQNKNDMFYVLNFSPEQQNTIKMRLDSTLKILIDMLKAMSVYKVTIASSDMMTDIAALPKAYINCRELLKSRVILGCNRIILSSDMPVPSREISSEVSSEGWAKIINAIELYDEDALKKAFNNICRQASLYFENYPNKAYDWYCDVILSIQSILLKQELIHTVKQLDTVNKINSCNEREQLQECANEIICKPIQIYHENSTYADNYLISKAKEYIYKNYYGKLDLGTVAQQVHLSPAYFGIIFKRETNKTFTEFVTGVRIDTAKVLLNDIKLSISDVAKKVGYKDIRHFNEIFKRTLGVTPKEYRKIRLYRSSSN